ncbi:DUF4129 domain-containing protein [Halobacillus sp. SY10]|uniref:Protein-glutamine gamma-glutamyltransferase-like C-terminal domain-containing protein n=1 Tax=Halobacillus aidingensis TaxID=240303 RepID=A0A1H0EAS9_HALAD|nr:DUF4129 domain-containing protein [Halobacillus aidingensis]SDN79544.1 protein of unknown function [Halobacillus aidingensis]
MSRSNEGKEQLKEILERPEYQAYEQESQTASQRLLDVIAQWVKELLETWFPNFQVSDSAINGWIYFFGFIGIGILLFFVIKLVGRLSGEKKLSEKRTFSMTSDLAWSSEKHVQEAEARAAGGQFSEAARHVFLGMLLDFDTRDLVEVKTWKTNGDYENELQDSNHALSADFSFLAKTFDQITYGNRTLQKEEFDEFRFRAFQWMDQEGRKEA